MFYKPSKALVCVGFVLLSQIFLCLVIYLVGCPFNFFYFVICFQGRHVKTGQLAAIKVMDVTGVSLHSALAFSQRHASLIIPQHFVLPFLFTSIYLSIFHPTSCTRLSAGRVEF